MPGHASNKESQHKCIGFSQALEEQRAKREERVGPQPWVGMKFAVGLVVALASYAYYVYVAKFCSPMIRREPQALDGRTVGIAFLIVFNILFLMFGWAYVKVVFTSPGYASDYVARTPPPALRPAPEPRPGPWESEESIRGRPYAAMAPPSRTYSRRSADAPSFSNGASSQRSPRPSRSPSQSRRKTHESHPSNSRRTTHESSTSHPRRNTHESTVSMSQARPLTHKRAGSTETGTVGATLPPVTSFGATSSSHRVKPPPPAHVPQADSGSKSGLPPLLFSRRPPSHSVLSPEYRYCSRDRFVKPMRAHHCRACGTCILKYDHHCPWIGQCVGAFNHKFFVNFLLWSSVFTIFIFVSLITLVVRTATSATPPSLDPQHIVIIALSGIFTLFTAALLASQVHLILLNTTTVEHLGMERMHDRERSVLAQMIRRPCSCSSEPVYTDATSGLLLSARSPIRVLVSRRRIVKQWDAEWGKIETEGNLWWLGSKRANWEATMGTSKLGWILPIGRSLGDGLTYPTNPRFDRDGRWRRRSEWPEGLQ